MRKKLKENAVQDDTVPPGKIGLDSPQQPDLFRIQPGIPRVKPVRKLHTAMAAPYSFQRMGQRQEDDVTLNRPLADMEFHGQIPEGIKAPPAERRINRGSPFGRIQSWSPPSVRGALSITKIPDSLCRV